MLRSLLLALFFLVQIYPVHSASAQGYPLSSEKLFFPACQAFSPQMTFDCYRDYSEVTSFLKAAADRYPALTSLSSIGKSYQGRELWMLTITNKATGDAADKPALWVDGGIDSDEVVSTEAALGLIHRLLTSNDPETKTLLDEKTFYIVPNIIPDMSELHHRSPIRPQDSTMRPWDDDNDGVSDEDAPDDLDGDNQTLQMRVVDATGDWVKDEKDSRLMRRRKLGDMGPFYKLYSEGIDNDGDGAYNEDWPGGIDPNRNYPGNWSEKQRGSGPFPGSELELRATLDFIQMHPNIAASQHLHSSGGVILRPPSVPDMPLPAADRALYLAIAERGLEITEYPLSTSVYDWNWPRGSKNTKRGQLWRDASGEIRGAEAAQSGGNFYAPIPEEDRYAAYGGSIDGLYKLFGVLSFANEIYSFGEDYDKNGTISRLEQLQFQDENMEGQVFKDWQAFDHPDLGPVEIGGWRKFGQNNPLAQDLQREVDRNVDFMLLQAESMPQLAIKSTEQTNLGDGLYRIHATVANHGFQPTELVVRRNAGRALTVKMKLESEAAVVLTENETVDLGHLDGFQEGEATWIVKGTAGTTLNLSVAHPKGGKAMTTLTLE